MGFSLGYLLEATLLVVNGLAVLQDYSPNLQPDRPPVPRFLAKIGWTAEASNNSFGSDDSIKNRLIHVINAVRTLLRVPLIAVNILTIVYLLFFG
eukprot:m.12479 g.12479  ORF g.12479 m.12479 type:complete len:95 (+) comp3235_c0_seq2:21-305(+)